MGEKKEAPPLISFFKESKTKKKKAIKFDGQYKYQVLITCDGERQQYELLKELEKRGLKCQILISL
jgi:hypothetical protein